MTAKLGTTQRRHLKLVLENVRRMAWLADNIGPSIGLRMSREEAERLFLVEIPEIRIWLYKMAKYAEDVPDGISCVHFDDPATDVESGVA